MAQWPDAPELSTRYPIYTRLNASDVLPNPLSPLGATMVWEKAILVGFSVGYLAMKGFHPHELLRVRGTAAAICFGNLYVNQSVARTIAERSGISWQAFDQAFFSGDPNTPPHEPHPDDVDEALSASMGETAQWTLTTTTYPDLDEDTRLAEEARASRPDFASSTNLGLVARARSMMPIESLMWRGEVVAGNQGAVGAGVIASILGEHAAALTTRLVGSAGDVESAMPPLAIWQLSRSVRNSPELTAEFDRGVDGLLARLEANHPDFAVEVHGFMRAWGYRGPSEWDIASDSWETRPELVLTLVDRVRGQGDEMAPDRLAIDRERDTALALDEALAIIGDNAEAKALLMIAIASARRFASWRERGKANCIKVLHEARVALLEVGRRLHAEGRIDYPEQVFMAVDDELEEMVLDPAPLVERFREREQIWKELFDTQIPTTIDARQPYPVLESFPKKSAAKTEVSKVGDVLTGVPAAAGVATGIARIINSEDDFGSFEVGEILVAPQTDPSWTPLFMAAAGVIVDVGGMSSHAMIVSRELGIPCVAGVNLATKRIPNGARVSVDGSTGTVTLL